jgi:hypothetical protein
MKKHPSLMGGSRPTVPHPVEEPIHKSLARGAFHKAAEKFRNGEMSDGEFDKHIHQAHSRLQDPMPMMSAVPMEPVKAGKQKHHGGRKTKVRSA